MSTTRLEHFSCGFDVAIAGAWVAVCGITGVISELTVPLRLTKDMATCWFVAA